MKIQIEQSDTKGAVFYEKEGVRLAEMTYSIAGSELIIVDHTDVHESLKGKSLGKKLLMSLVEKVRKEGVKILPLCPFAKSVFDKDDSIRDVLR